MNLDLVMLETRIFSHPFDYNLRIYGITAQAGYSWMNGERAAFRSGGEVTFWGYRENNYHSPQLSSTRRITLFLTSWCLTPCKSNLLCFIIFFP